MFTRPRSTPGGPPASAPQPGSPQTAMASSAPPHAAPEPAAVTAVEPVAAPARRFTDAVPPCVTRLGQLRIRGTLTGSDSVELSGRFDGPINVDGMCHVREGGRVTGELAAGDAVIDGEVDGRLTVTGRLELRARARVLADVEAETIAIAEGCFIEGRIHMRGSNTGSQPTSFQERRKGRKRATPKTGARSAR